MSFHCYANDNQLHISSRPGETHQIEKLTEYIVGCSVNYFSSVRNLNVLFDSNLSFQSLHSSICETAFFNLKNISKL